MNEDASSCGAKIIIAYHPSVRVNEDGTLKIMRGAEENAAKIQKLCRENGIYYLDTGNHFLEEYEKDYTLPYGFMNTSVGRGHMNKYGQKMFAEEIYKLIQEIEAQS